MEDDKYERPDTETGRTIDVRQTLVRDFVDVTWRMVVPTVLGIFFGIWLDIVFGISPTMFMVGAVLGFLAGIYLAVRVINQTKEKKR